MAKVSGKLDEVSNIGGELSEISLPQKVIDARNNLSKLVNEAPQKEFLPGKTSSDITNILKGERPNPESYLDPEYISEESKLFEDGVARISGTDRWLNETGYMGVTDPEILNGAVPREYVFPKDYLDSIVNASGGDIRFVEDSLGLSHGTLGDNPVIMQVEKGDYTGVDIPNGNEFGANDEWIPGGKLPTGIPEATIDPVPADKVITKKWGDIFK